MTYTFNAFALSDLGLERIIVIYPVIPPDFESVR
jgi:hypothetical protein